MRKCSNQEEKDSGTTAVCHNSTDETKRRSKD